ncbi:MAG TPA: hypothetical protein VIM41_03080 [Gammaproteobacteria bacterium]
MKTKKPTSPHAESTHSSGHFFSVAHKDTPFFDFPPTRPLSTAVLRRRPDTESGLEKAHSETALQLKPDGAAQPEASDGLDAHELTHAIQPINVGPVRRKTVSNRFTPHCVQPPANRQPLTQRSLIQRKIAVNPGLHLDTQGFTTTKTGDEYTCPAIVKNSLWNEIFTALLFSPRVFRLEGSTNAQINASFLKHMKSRWGIVKFAAKKGYSFGAGADFKMNPDYWIVDASGWRLKPGVNRRQAILDLNIHPEKYSIACLAATQLTMEGGGKSPTTDDYGVAADDWIPGDWGYITNTSFPSSGGTIGLEGENIIYTGKDMFWGHFGPGNAYRSLTEWYAEVEAWDGGANIEDFRTRPSIGLV